MLQRWVRGVLETRNSIDELLAPRLEPKTPDFVRNLLRVAVYQLRYLERIPEHVVVHESVEVIKAGKYSRLSGLVNAVLRSVQRESQQAASESVAAGERERARQRRVRLIILSGCCAAGLRSLAPSKRACYARLTIKSGRCTSVRMACALPSSELQQALALEGLEAEPALYARDCLRVLQLPRSTRLQRLKAYTQGLFFVQDQSSIFIQRALSAKARREHSRHV